MKCFSVGTIQTNMNTWTRRLIDAPTLQNGTVLLDGCPSGTHDVHTFDSAAKAAGFMGCSISTVYRQAREIASNARELNDLYNE